MVSVFCFACMCVCVCLQSTQGHANVCNVLYFSQLCVRVRRIQASLASRYTLTHSLALSFLHTQTHTQPEPASLKV